MKFYTITALGLLILRSHDIYSSEPRTQPKSCNAHALFLLMSLCGLYIRRHVLYMSRKPHGRTFLVLSSSCCAAEQNKTPFSTTRTPQRYVLHTTSPWNSTYDIRFSGFRGFVLYFVSCFPHKRKHMRIQFILVEYNIRIKTMFWALLIQII